MSVVRFVYRQLLHVGKKVSDKYADPNDMCFALFGLLVTRQDFMNAGYGNQFAQVLRTCFLRPSVAGDPHDTKSARMNAAFDALRRLNELNASNAAFMIRDLRRQMSDAAEGKTEGAGASAGVVVAPAGAREPSPSTATAAVTPCPPFSTATSSAPAAGTGDKASAPASPGSSSSLPGAAAANAKGAPAVAANLAVAAATAAPHTKSGVTTYRLDEGVDLIRGSVLIERSSRRRIQNFPRHCVVCEPVSMAFPPYRFCVPPEPAYLLAVRNEFALYCITDVLLALSATSIFNAHRQAHLRRLSTGLHAGSPSTHSEVVGNASAALTPPSDETHADVTDASAATPAPRGFPTTREEFRQLMRKIPTRTILQTDVLEVEITTEYVCSNPSSVASVTSNAAGTSVEEQKQQRHRKDRAFTSTTPLKRGAFDSGSAGTAEKNSSSSSSTPAFRDSAGASSHTGNASQASEAQDDSKAHLFLYYVYVRNRGPQKNPQRWHAQILSHHLVVVDVAQGQVLEMGRPGVMGNFPLLAPGASHCFESGTTLAGPEGLIRGSIQVNLFNDAGEMVTLDAAVAPTRLTVEVTSAEGFTSSKHAKEELVQRSAESAVSGSAEEARRVDSGNEKVASPFKRSGEPHPRPKDKD